MTEVRKEKQERIVRFAVAKFVNGVEKERITSQNGFNFDYNLGVATVGGTYYFTLEQDAKFIAEAKNRYAQLHSITDTEFKVLREEVITTVVSYEKVDYLKDRPTVEIEEEDTHKANPSVIPANKEGQGKGENDEVEIG